MQNVIVILIILKLTNIKLAMAERILLDHISNRMVHLF